MYLCIYIYIYVLPCWKTKLVNNNKKKKWNEKGEEKNKGNQTLDKMSVTLKKVIWQRAPKKIKPINPKIYFQKKKKKPNKT